MELPALDLAITCHVFQRNLAVIPTHHPVTPFVVRQTTISYCLHVLAEEVLCGQYLLSASIDSLILPGIKPVREKMCFSNSNKEIWVRIKKSVVLF